MSDLKYKDFGPSLYSRNHVKSQPKPGDMPLPSVLTPLMDILPGPLSPQPLQTSESLTGATPVTSSLPSFGLKDQIPNGCLSGAVLGRWVNVNVALIRVLCSVLCIISSCKRAVFIVGKVSTEIWGRKEKMNIPRSVHVLFSVEALAASHFQESFLSVFNLIFVLYCDKTYRGLSLQWKPRSRRHQSLTWLLPVFLLCRDLWSAWREKPQQRCVFPILCGE